MYCSRRDRSNKSESKQHTFSSTLEGTLSSRACGRSLRLIHCRAVPGTNNGDLYRRGDRSPFSQANFCPTAAAPAPARSAGLVSSSRSFERRSRFFGPGAFPSKIERSHAVIFPPLQILIFAAFDADISAGVSSAIAPRWFFPLHFHIYLRRRGWPTFSDRVFALRFFHFGDRCSFVGQRVARLSPMSPRSARLVRGNVPGRFGNLVSIPRALSARGAGVRRVSGASLVFPNNCPQRRPYAELRTYRVRSCFARL